MAAVSILVVDDDAPFRTALSRILRAAGHAVDEAADGAQALRVVEADTPDLLITDLVMPDNDGIELIVAVRKAHPAVRILVISGRWIGDMSLLTMAARLGADATLAKPFSNEQLFETLAQVMAPR